ncbi:Proteophosphoglycan ppg4, related [Eimeria tenella]|uniref:Proteophosphoglycan ppg4, related n=1 Tax=Eimeria tenella TaxID=5802 RepID=U6L007_EIMTE|nr:Proteophosphoglycan ppg4, related [Eimeria tenella]CDJ42508.1 Proteophosphoglycan ppg4, related [Eimeria tenella]|eukprot:XP_013233258.1 Proteophosphoglycan ppg4, related [Eimeria tenella]
MRRASPNGCAGYGGPSSEVSKGLARLSTTSSVGSEKDCGRSTSMLLPTDVRVLITSRTSQAGEGPAHGAESPLSAASTPTRKSGAKTQGISFHNGSSTADTDQLREKLQQMWDDGELSPRAPLDRSLGYCSTSPNNSGKKLGVASSSLDSATKSPEGCKASSQQQDVGATVFISDVRALRQMAPFSSTEEQVLTRSQRKRSSASLLQQLVADYPNGTIQGQQKDQDTAAQNHQHEGLEGLQTELRSAAESQQQKYLTKTAVDALDLSIDRSKGPITLPSPDAASRGLGTRKRRASSPLAPTYSFSSDSSHAKVKGDMPKDVLPNPKSRKRLSAFSSQTLGPSGVPAGAWPRRGSAAAPVALNGENGATRGIMDATANCASNSSSTTTIESPFQKHPPPSPSDFPSSSPINTTSHPLQQFFQAKTRHQGHSRQACAADGRRPSGSGPAANPLSSPVQVSPRRTQTGAEASYPSFQTPRVPFSSPEPREGRARASIRSKISQRCPSPLPLVTENTPSKKAVGRRGCSGCPSKSPPGRGASLTVTEAQQRVCAVPLGQEASAKATAVSRRASAVPVSKLKAPSESFDNTAAKLLSQREAEPPEGVTRAREVSTANSPIRNENFISPWQRAGRSSAPPTRAVAPKRHSKGQQMPATTASNGSSRNAGAKTELSCKPSCPRSTEPRVSCGAAASSARRRSVTRRSNMVRASTLSRLPSAPSSHAVRRSVSLTSGASQDGAVSAASAVAATCPVRIVRNAPPGERKRTPRHETSPSKAEMQCLPSSRSATTCIKLGARLGVVSSVGSSKGGRGSTAIGVSVAAKAATAVAERGCVARAVPARSSTDKTRKSSCLVQSTTARRTVRVLPIAKPGRLLPILEKDGSSGRSSVSSKSVEAARGVRTSRSRTPASPPASQEPSGLASSQQGGPSVKCSSASRMNAEFELSSSPAVQSTDATDTGSKMPATSDGLSGHSNGTEERTGNSGSSPETEFQFAPSGSPKFTANFDDGQERGTDENTVARSRRDPSYSIHVDTTSAPHDAKSSIDICVATTGGTSSSQKPRGNAAAQPQNRRRSSSPHNLSLQKVATEVEMQHPETFASMRRASSVCSIEDGDGKWVPAHQQKREALHKEWAIRDREYQEKQQNLLLEQQRKERLLAWEQREAELLKNRKALSKEEPSFWGFDPFMVDEEDEKVLTTEELRVEVSRFLKGDLRFHSRADLLRVVKKFSEQTRTTTTTTSSRLNFTKVEQRVVPMAARQVHGTVPHERRRKSILRNSSGTQQSECRRRSRGISFSPFNKVQLYMLDEHERASKEAAAHLSQQGEQRQQLRQKLMHQFQLLMLRGDSDLELAVLRRQLADLYDPDDEDSVAFLSPTLTPGREVEAANKCSPSASQQEGGERSMAYSDEERTGSMASEQNGAGRLPFTVSPSWRQRPHGIWQEPPGAPQTEPCAEWSPPPSPMEHNRVNGMGGKEDNNCWETTSLGTGTALEDDREHNRKDNDENANCNAAQSPKHLYSTQETLELKHPGKDVPAEETPKPPLEANRRHSVLSRRLSVVPNAHLSP